LLSIGINIGLYAQKPLHKQGSSLEVEFQKPGNYIIYFDNKPYTIQGKSITIGDLQPGDYVLKIMRKSPKSKPETLSKQIIEIERNSVHKVEFDHQFYSSLKIYPNGSENTRPYTRPEHNERPHVETPVIIEEHIIHEQPIVVDVPVVEVPMLNTEQLKQTVDNTSFEDEKLNIVMQAIENNVYSAQQVKSMMDWFSFESTKLDLAKKAYANCVNKNEYYIVNSGFSFSSSVSDLKKYIDASNSNHN